MNLPIGMSLNSLGLADLTAVKCTELETLFLHSGDGRIRLIRLTSLPCRILHLKLGEILAQTGTYGLPSMGAGIAETRE